MISNIKIASSLKELILPLSQEEYLNLESNLIKEGCRDPLVVWKKSKGTRILIDGHHRHEICTKRNIPFKVDELDFEDIEEAKSWMISNQLGRRNLTKEQASYYRGLKYLKLKKRKGGYQNVTNKGESEATSAMLSAEFKVSESTIKRDAKFAEALEIIAQTNVKLRNSILTGDTDLKKSDILMLLKAPKPEETKIYNEADLFNQARLIEKTILDEVEDKVSMVARSQLQESKKVIDDIEPLFLDREDRIRKIKGAIISAMNRTINNRDFEAINDLKGLIVTLQGVIFSEE